jgi:hypothetical protein
MKAAFITRYGSPDVVKILDVPKPVPAANEVLIRVHAATVNPGCDLCGGGGGGEIRHGDINRQARGVLPITIGYS